MRIGDFIKIEERRYDNNNVFYIIKITKISEEGIWGDFQSVNSDWSYKRNKSTVDGFFHFRVIVSVSPCDGWVEAPVLTVKDVSLGTKFKVKTPPFSPLIDCVLVTVKIGAWARHANNDLIPCYNNKDSIIWGLNPDDEIEIVK